MKHAAQPARFDPIVNQYNQLGELFRIKGRCQPGCTLFLVAISSPAYPSQIDRAARRRPKKVSGMRNPASRSRQSSCGIADAPQVQ